MSFHRYKLQEVFRFAEKLLDEEKVANGTW